MTKITIFKDNRGSIKGYEVSGHTEYGAHGEDVLCASISTVTQGALLSLDQVCNIDEKNKDYILRNGYLKVTLFGDMDEKKAYSASIVLDSMLIVLRDIKEQYPKFITINYEEV